jgi:uncharacterized protein YjiS (DUF1127 family)
MLDPNTIWQQHLNWSVAMTTRIQFGLPAVSDPAFRGLPRRVTGRGWFFWVRAAAARWRQRRMLETLDDRMLADFGIGRSQALEEARKPCWRP